MTRTTPLQWRQQHQLEDSNNTITARETMPLQGQQCQLYDGSKDA
jgi:hypothetical protein